MIGEGEGEVDVVVWVIIICSFVIFSWLVLILEWKHGAELSNEMKLQENFYENFPPPTYIYSSTKLRNLFLKLFSVDLFLIGPSVESSGLDLSSTGIKYPHT